MRAAGLRSAAKKKRPAGAATAAAPSKRLRPAASTSQGAPAEAPVPASRPVIIAASVSLPPAATASPPTSAEIAASDVGSLEGGTVGEAGFDEPATGGPPAAEDMPQLPGRGWQRASTSEGDASIRPAGFVGRRGYVDIGSGEAGTAFRDPAAAGKILSALRLTPDWEFISRRDVFAVARQSKCTLYRLLHEQGVLEQMASKSAGQLVSMRAQLTQERKESQERETKSAEEASRLRAMASAAEARAKAAEELTAIVVGKLEAAGEQHQAALAEVKNLSGLAKRLKRERKDLREEVKSLQRAREAAARRAEDDLAMAELTAVEKYKTSAEYEKAMVDGTVDSYIKGIDVTLERVRRLHPHLDLEGLESDDEAEEASDEEAEAEEAWVEEAEVEEAGADVGDGDVGVDWSDGEPVAVTSPVDGRPTEEDPAVEREAVEGTDREDLPVEELEGPARPGTLVVALPAAPPEVVGPIEIE